MVTVSAARQTALGRYGGISIKALQLNIYIFDERAGAVRMNEQRLASDTLQTFQ